MKRELLFSPDSLDPSILSVEPLDVSFEGPEYTFTCPMCSKPHRMVCMAGPGQSLVFTLGAGRALTGGFASSGLDYKSGPLVEKITKEHDATLVAAIVCPNHTEVELNKELTKRKEVFNGYTRLLKALLDNYKPSRITTVGRFCYEILTGRSVPDESIYGAYTFLGGVPVQAVPSPKFEMLAPFRKKRWREAFVKALSTTPRRIDVSKATLARVETHEDALEATTALKSGRFMYFDIEFAGNPYDESFDLLCLAAKCPDSNDVYLWSRDALRNYETKSPLIAMLADPTVKKGAHNAKAEWLGCTRFYPELRRENGTTRISNLYADSMIMVHLLGYGGQVRLSTVAEYVGLGGQKDEAQAAVKGQGELVRELQKCTDKGLTFEEGLIDYKKKLVAKLSKLCKKDVVASYAAEGIALKAARVMASAEIAEAAEGRSENSALSKTWKDLIERWGAPLDRPLLRLAVEDVDSEPERYTYGLIDSALLENYCAKDVFTGCEVAAWVGKRVVNEPGLRKTWFEMVAPGTETVSQMEQNGLPTEAALLEAVAQQVDEEMSTYTAQLQDLGFVGELSKNADVGKFLYETLGLTPPLFTDGGAPSVAKDAIEALIEDFPENPAMKILEAYNKAATIAKSFGRKLVRKVQVDGCIHGTFKTDGAETGRLIACNPNLQQLPSRSQYAPLIKGSFVGRINGRQGVVIQLDFSQIELRIAASLAADPVMISAFCSGDDFHRSTAATVWNVKPEEVTKSQRSDAKAVNFGLVFNKTVRSLAEDLKKSIAETQEIKDQIMGRFSVLEAKLREWERFAEQHGYIRTYGWNSETKEWEPRRIRYLHDIRHENGGFASTAKNGSVNTPIQGTAGDYTIQKMTKINKWLNDSGVEAKLVLTVHDSIVLISSFKDALKVATTCKRIMEEDSPGGVPILADCEIGLDYGHGYPLQDVSAGAAMLAKKMPIEDVEKVTGILHTSKEFGILEHLSNFIEREAA